MFNKKILGLAVFASMVSTNVFAASNLDGTVTSVKYASETMPTATTVGSTTGQLIADGGANLSVLNKIGFGVGSGTTLYVRYDLTGAVFTDAPTIAANDTNTLDCDGGGNPPSATLSTGGTAGDTFVVVSVACAQAAMPQDEAFTLTSKGTDGDLAVTGSATSVQARARVYDDAGQASSGGSSSLYDTGDKTIVDVSKGLTVTPVAQTATAGVTEDYKKFNKIAAASGAVADADTNTTATMAAGPVTIGSYKFTESGALSAIDGATAVVADADFFAPATTKITVNGAMDPWGTKLFIDASNGACAGSDLDLTIDAGKTAAEATGIAAVDTKDTAWAICGTADGTTAVNKVPYTLSIDFGAPAAGPGTADIVDTAIGGTDRDGTTLNIAYMTTYADYNQRFYFVNRGTTDAAYSCTYTPESGTTAAAGTAATGTVPAGETISMKAGDMVTLTGKTRTAATCVLAADPSNIDASSQTVNLADKSTDTILLD